MTAAKDMLDALIWVVVVGVLAFMMWRVRRRRPHVGSVAPALCTTGSTTTNVRRLRS